LSGTVRALVANMVTGVTKGFREEITLVGSDIARRPRAIS
jgi:ribosomal protein L6P/L9E